jgi:hypothetical protein
VEKLKDAPVFHDADHPTRARVPRTNGRAQISRVFSVNSGEARFQKYSHETVAQILVLLLHADLLPGLKGPTGPVASTSHSKST